MTSLEVQERGLNEVKQLLLSLENCFESHTVDVEEHESFAEAAAEQGISVDQLRNKLSGFHVALEEVRSIYEFYERRRTQELSEKTITELSLKEAKELLHLNHRCTIRIYLLLAEAIKKHWNYLPVTTKEEMLQTVEKLLELKSKNTSIAALIEEVSRIKGFAKPSTDPKYLEGLSLQTLEMLDLCASIHLIKSLLDVSGRKISEFKQSASELEVEQSYPVDNVKFNSIDTAVTVTNIISDMDDESDEDWYDPALMERFLDFLMENALKNPSMYLEAYTEEMSSEDDELLKDVPLD